MDTQDNSKDFAQQALEELSKSELKPTPDNFSVYYNYFSDSNPNLKMAINMLLEQYGKLNQTQCTELFLAHISLDAESKVLQTTTTSIEDEVKKMMGVLTKSASDTKQYNQTLDAFSGNLQSPDSVDQIRGAVSRVANETRIMAEQNQRLHAQLSQSTQQLTEMRYNLDEVRKASLMDPLTEVGNRKFFSNEIARVIEEAKESETPLSMLMADIDHFKNFNDTYGHLIGDEVLKLVARTLVENLKGRDIIARYGGEEFVILLPRTTVKDAIRVGDQLRSILSTKNVRRRRTNETLGVITISIGATQHLEGDTHDSFIARADAGLYKAKETGRNKVMAQEEDPPQE
ncbi:MAG TPA: hypothetical protein DD400_02585 [Rhodospirillaceae bacterium]|nr:hypothetical protein [Rhodospirillaceae bacterium]